MAVLGGWAVSYESGTPKINEFSSLIDFSQDLINLRLNTIHEKGSKIIQMK